MAETANKQADMQAAKGEWQKLVRLFAEASPMRMGHWNPRTGEIFVAPRRKGTHAIRNARADAGAFELRLLQEEGWVEVPYLESDEAYALAVAWAESLDPGRGKTAIVAALADPKPFRRLRAVLGQMAGMRRRYDKAVQEEAEARLVEFCVGLGLTLEHPRFAELAPEFRDPELIAFPASVQRRVSALSIGRPPCG